MCKRSVKAERAMKGIPPFVRWGCEKELRVLAITLEQKLRKAGSNQSLYFANKVHTPRGGSYKRRLANPEGLSGGNWYREEESTHIVRGLNPVLFSLKRKNNHRTEGESGWEMIALT